MEEWPKSIFEILESVACMVDEFFVEVTEMVEVVADDLQNTVGVEIDRCFQDMFDPIVESLYADLEAFIGETEQAFTYPVEPMPDQHPACIGCHHYHGQVYSGNLFVCAMHPYGWDSNECPDWEGNKI
ncbi:MAG TPA: hypothetical protein DCE56_21700 [Cyanobacteria bacterium UBA8553]|nr:hypothetical protein [Cyanobacteria bacterium UBA8553]HAJ58710.1 hypothetical protein [Cyanobacteria bacterium UBA8543]